MVSPRKNNEQKFMGLDMYLYTSNQAKKKQSTGACGGLFPLAPANEHEGVELQEMGYWRKNYKLNEYIVNDVVVCDEEPNLIKFPLSVDDLENIRQFAKSEKLYLEEGGDDENGWYTIEEWEYTIKTFNKAIRQAKQGFNIYYECWY